MDTLQSTVVESPTPKLFKIRVRGGYETIVDEDVYYQIRLVSWRLLNSKQKFPYVCGNIHGKRVLLHRWIMDAPGDMIVDHRNGDTLDNRRENLRLCTNSQNQANRTDARGQSEYKGVYLDRRTGRWVAGICYESSTRYLGQFDSEEEAAAAYNQAALSLFGPFAALNLPRSVLPRLKSLDYPATNMLFGPCEY